MLFLWFTVTLRNIHLFHEEVHLAKEATFSLHVGIRLVFKIRSWRSTFTPIFGPTYFLTYLLIYILTYLLIYIHTYLLTYLFTYLLTYLLTPCSRVLPEKLTGSQLVKKFPAFYGTRRFITAFASACHLSLSWASSIQSIPPHPTSWRSVLILSPHLRVGLPSWALSVRFPHQNPVDASPLPHTRCIPRPSHYSHFRTH